MKCLIGIQNYIARIRDLLYGKKVYFGNPLSHGIITNIFFPFSKEYTDIASQWGESLRDTSLAEDNNEPIFEINCKNKTVFRFGSQLRVALTEQSLNEVPYFTEYHKITKMTYSSALKYAIKIMGLVSPLNLFDSLIEFSKNPMSVHVK